MQKSLSAIALAALFLTSRAFAAPPVQTPEQPMTAKSNAKPTPEQEKALLTPYRAKIDALDNQIVALLGERFGVISEVAKLKAEHGIAPILPYRVEEVVRNARARAEKAGVDPDLVEKIYRIIIDTACKQEEDYAHAQQAKAPPQAKPE
jgi:chorismate mutase-like protein